MLKCSNNHVLILGITLNVPIIGNLILGITPNVPILGITSNICLHLPVPLMIGARHNPNHHFPRHRWASIATKYHLPVVCAMGENDIGAHTHPECILPYAHCVAIIADVSFRVLQVRVPQKNCCKTRNVSNSKMDLSDLPILRPL